MVPLIGAGCTGPEVARPPQTYKDTATATLAVGIMLTWLKFTEYFFDNFLGHRDGFWWMWLWSFWSTNGVSFATLPRLHFFSASYLLVNLNHWSGMRQVKSSLPEYVVEGMSLLQFGRTSIHKRVHSFKFSPFVNNVSDCCSLESQILRKDFVSHLFLASYYNYWELNVWFLVTGSI